jgi:hypothetical protein
MMSQVATFAAQSEERRTGERDPRPAVDRAPPRASEPDRPVFAPVAVPSPTSGLTVGSAHDPAEAEADRMSLAVLQRLGAGSAAAAPVRRSAEPEVGADGGALSSTTRSSIDRLRGGGRPLPEPVRNRMEGAFGADFSDVRVHTGAQAGALSRRLGALAFTAGSDIVLSEGSGVGDQRVLAHELTHVLQNRGG